MVTKQVTSQARRTDERPVRADFVIDPLRQQGLHVVGGGIDFFSQLALQLKEYGVKNFIIAGGETSGVVTQSLAVDAFHIGPQITPGVPWVKSVLGNLSLALKSGNFGDQHFFTTAQEFYND